MSANYDTGPVHGGKVGDQPPAETIETYRVGEQRELVVTRERDRFGGMKFGSAFFGWLTAMGTAVLLTALLAAAGTAIGLAAADNGVVQDATTAVTDTAASIGIAGIVALLVILFVSYFCGGYVAGRMARFDGAKQGVAVWLWSILIAVVVAAAGALLGDQYDVLSRLNGFPRLPVNEGDLTAAGIVTAIVLAGVALLGAVLGGRAGMRYHRRIDQAGLSR
ncbi:hypothetical protein ACFQY4_19900 [Catellatospora bangladeshensis]|uniref:Uncharacterized protein n=1 Tax=Catellatospora bangladeshensis TaxID=310355 RepID=A0A8J3JVR3_9ACTN|nr:hypothetical protein [Catellatospora bangladeshensis]GIF85938.1 hypothetical protein Cba03nite_72870 [Catellatospora bangladeshensis]